MEKTKIEWCDSTWNPVTGCYNGCPYCYAKVTANRFKGCDSFPDGDVSAETIYLTERQLVTTKRKLVKNAAYPFGFKPTFHEYRLDDLKTKKFGKTIFVCSMADLFGDWVPDGWIEKVFNACLGSPEHRYLFLTKNPKRYIELSEKGKLPEVDFFWYGSSATTTSAPVFFSDSHNTFASIEPILEPFCENGLDLVSKVDWAIFGAETGNRSDKVVPDKSWIEYAVKLFRNNGKAVFMKDSLLPIWGDNLITETPWNK